MKTVHFYISESDHVEFMAGGIDISYAGMGLQTYVPLERGQVLSFHKGIAHGKGLIKWQRKLGDNNYRVGINFVENLL